MLSHISLSHTTWTPQNKKIKISRLVSFDIIQYCTQFVRNDIVFLDTIDYPQQARKVRIQVSS